MSIKTSKRIALGVIASLVFAPFAVIAPASAASSSPVITDSADVVVIGETATSTMTFVTAADNETATLSIVVPNGSARTLTNVDGSGTDIFAATDGDSTFNATTGVVTDVTSADDSAGTITLVPDVPGKYVVTLLTGDAATDTYTITALPSTAGTTSLSVVQTASSGASTVSNVIAVVRNSGALNTDGQILAQPTESADTTDLSLSTVFGSSSGTPAGEEITVGGTALTPSFTVDRTNLTAGSYTLRFWVDSNSNGTYQSTEVSTTATFTVTAPTVNSLTNASSSYELEYAAIAGFCYFDTNTDSKVNFVEFIYTAADSDNFVINIESNLSDITSGELRATISGPAIWTDTTATANETISTDKKTLTVAGADVSDLTAGEDLSFTITGTGTVAVTIREVLTTGVTRTAGSYTVDAVTACSNGSYSAAESGLRVQSNQIALTAKPIADVSGANTIARGGTGYIAVFLADVNGALITDPANVLTATSSAAVTLGWDGLGTEATATVRGADVGDAVLYVRAVTTGTIMAAPIEIKLNGTVLATKTLNFTGAADKIAISAKKISIPTGIATADAFKYAVSDSAGNRIASSASVFTVDGTYVTAATAAAGSATAASGVEVTCSALRGKGSVTLAWGLLGDKREVVEVICAGGIATFEVTTSKSSYERSEIGVLTISAKDLAGNPVPDGTDLATAAGKIQFTGSGATLAKSPAATDEFVDGKIDYAFTTSATAGSYNFALWHGDLSPAVTKIAAFTVNPAVVAPTYTKPTLTASLENGRVLLFGACEADEGDIIIYVKSPGKPWNEKAKTLECVAGEFEGSVRAPKSFPKYYRVKQEGTALWSSSVLVRP